MIKELTRKHLPIHSPLIVRYQAKPIQVLILVTKLVVNCESSIMPQLPDSYKVGIVAAFRSPGEMVVDRELV